MLDVFRHQRGKVYPSWTDNPRLVLARRLRDMPINAAAALAEGFAIYRVSDRHYKVLRSGSEVFYTYRAGNQGGSGPNLTAANIQHVLDFIFHEETSPMALPPLSDKAIDCLCEIQRAGSIAPDKLKIHKNIITALRDRELIKVERGGKLGLTLAGEAAVKSALEARQAAAENGGRSRGVLKVVESKAPEPEGPPVRVSMKAEGISLEVESEAADAAGQVDAFASALANVAIHVSGGSEPYPAALIDSVMGEGEIVVCAALVYELHPPLRHLVESLRALGVEPAVIARLQISIFDARDPGDEEV